VAACEAKEGTREEVAQRFRVSVGLVKKLLMQRNRTGDLRPRYRCCGRKARLVPEHGERMRQLVGKEPDVTLEEIKRRLGLVCTIGAIQRVLAKMGLTYKKRRSKRPRKTGLTARGMSSATHRRTRRTQHARKAAPPEANG
jgi:transposase